MKKRITLLLIASLTGALMTFAPTVPTAFADENDDSAIALASDAISEIYAYLDESQGKPNEQFFPEFADKADTTKQKISRAYADLGKTGEVGEVLQNVQDVRGTLADMKRELADWRSAALAADAELFDSVTTEFGDTVDAYNSAVGSYDTNATKAGTSGAIFIVAALLLVIALPIVLIVRNIKLKKKRAAQYTEAANKSLTVSPLKFLLLNLATLNIYLIYWGWQSWEIIAKTEDKKYHSTLRSWFFIFTSFSLFKKTNALAATKGYKHMFNDQILAVGVLVLTTGATIVWRQSNNVAVLIGAVLAESVLMTLLVRPILKAQAYYVTRAEKPLLPIGKDLWPLALMMISFVLTIVALVSVGLGVY